LDQSPSNGWYRVIFPVSAFGRDCEFAPGPDSGPSMVIAWLANGSCQRACGTGSPGHDQSLKRREIQVGNDRFQGTADIARRPRAATGSPKLSLDDS